MLLPARARLAEPARPFITHEVRRDPAHPDDPSKNHKVAIANIPLPGGGDPAQCDAGDFNELMRAGYGDAWWWHNNGHGAAYIRTTHVDKPRRTFIPARFIVGVGFGQRVRYLDRNPRNLRRENLYVGAGFAKVAERMTGGPPVSDGEEW